MYTPGPASPAGTLMGIVMPLALVAAPARAATAVAAGQLSVVTWFEFSTS